MPFRLLMGAKVAWYLIDHVGKKELNCWFQGRAIISSQTDGSFESGYLTFLIMRSCCIVDILHKVSPLGASNV